MSILHCLTWLRRWGKPGRISVIFQHPTSAWEPRYVLTPPQSLFVFRCYLCDVFHHYFFEERNTNHTTRESNGTGWKRCALHCGCIMRNALCVFETETTTTSTHAVVSEKLEPRYGSVAPLFISDARKTHSTKRQPPFHWSFTNTIYHSTV